jgi:predicted aconitase with swiveling domain
MIRNSDAVPANTIHADRTIVDASCSGPVLQLLEPLSFWGGFDPETGEITEVHHPQCGQSIAGTVLLLEQTRGSTSSPGDLVEALHLGNGPTGIIIGQADMTIITAALVAAELYGCQVPVLVVKPKDWVQIPTGSLVSISSGIIKAATIHDR